MKRLKLWGGKAWCFFGDDRVGLVIGGALLNGSIDDLIAGRFWRSAFGLALSAFCIWTGWRGLAGKAKAVRP